MPRAIIMPMYFFFLTLSVQKPIDINDHATMMSEPPMMRIVGISELVYFSTSVALLNNVVPNSRQPLKKLLPSSVLQIKKIVNNETTTTTTNQRTNMKPLRSANKAGKTRTKPVRTVPNIVKTKKNFDHLYKPLPLTGLPGKSVCLFSFLDSFFF